MEVGACYALARVEDRIRVFGPVDTGQLTVRHELPLDQAEVVALEDRPGHHPARRPERHLHGHALGRRHGPGLPRVGAGAGRPGEPLRGRSAAMTVGPEPLRPQRVARAGLRTPGPEGVATVAALVVVLVLGASFGGAFGGGGPVGPTSAPTPDGSPAEPEPSRLVDRAIADLLLAINDQLIDAGGQLAAEVERDPSSPTEIATLFREVNATTRHGAEALPALGSTPQATDFIARLGPVYDEIRTIADATLGSSITNTLAYEQGATRLVEVIAALPALQIDLQGLRDAVVMPSAPPASVAPSDGSPSDTPPSDAPTTDAPPTKAPPTEAPPSGSPGPTTGTSQVVNGGFEDGVDVAWTLVVTDPGGASISADRSAPATGLISARVELGAVPQAFGAVSLQQEGMRLEAGAAYMISVALRAETVRDVRVRVLVARGHGLSDPHRGRRADLDDGQLHVPRPGQRRRSGHPDRARPLGCHDLDRRRRDRSGDRALSGPGGTAARASAADRSAGRRGVDGHRVQAARRERRPQRSGVPARTGNVP